MPARPRTIVHLAFRDDWERARALGRYEVSSRGATLADVGFVHASTSEQLPGTLERFYADVDRNSLVVLVLDVAALDAAGSPVRWEPVPGAPAPFPHVYGPIPIGAVLAVQPVDHP